LNAKKKTNILNDKHELT